MKNIIALEKPEEIHAFMKNLWRSEPFRKSHEEGGFIHRHVDSFAWLPRIFAETTNDYLERAHFCTWWNVIMLRPDYDNDVIHDLYLLHETYHAANMSYVSGIGRQAFDEKMQRNELEASVLSEITIYFELPELREASFPYEIYADRFLKDEKMQDLWKANRNLAIETFRMMRRNVMVSKPDHKMDKTETWIKRFADQNAAYNVVWADRFSDIEDQMAILQAAAASGNKSKGLANYLGWLKGESAKDCIHGIPFRLEAELFSPFYWANKEKYAKDMAA